MPDREAQKITQRLWNFSDTRCIATQACGSRGMGRVTTCICGCVYVCLCVSVCALGGKWLEVRYEI